jgi:hypothetical protein
MENQNHSTPTPAAAAASEPEPQSEDLEPSMANDMSTLAELGFLDVETNRRLLRRFGQNLEMTIDHLLRQASSVSSGHGHQHQGPDSQQQQQPESSRASTSASASGVTSAVVPALVDLTLDPPQGKRARRSSEARNKKQSLDPVHAQAEEDESCPICCVDFPSTPEHWKVSGKKRVYYTLYLYLIKKQTKQRHLGRM